MRSDRDRQDPWTAEELILCLEDAGAALLSLPGQSCLPAGYRCAWPQVVLAAVEAYGYDDDAPCRPPPPGAEQISRMDEALRWIALIPLERAPPGGGELFSRHGGAVLRRIVLMRALVHPVTGRYRWTWKKLVTTFGADYRCIQRWHAQAMAILVRELSRPGLCVAAGGRVGPSPLVVRTQLARLSPAAAARTRAAALAEA